eukprot:TRINITY_DN156_c0_g5_i2.p1 TRINITY_DN156_c0_g5~~TRINITY_DN156_c0_g5_i2.p1  ORF type:complete len:124 (+),score=30.56 TRINITY_DN156_c0_g5_i2:64-435(+)
MGGGTPRPTDDAPPTKESEREEDEEDEEDEESSWSEEEGPLCVVCNCGGGGALLLRCEQCDIALHSFCAHKRLSYVPPEQRWRCAKCYHEDDAGCKKLPRIRKYRKTKRSPPPAACVLPAQFS